MRAAATTCDDPCMGLSSTPDVPVRRLYRRTEGRVVAGVARGLADHLGLDVLLVRLGFVVLASANGAGLVMYAALWVFAPMRPAPAADESDSRDLGRLVALGALALGGMLLLSTLGVGLHPGVLVPLFAVGFGVVMLWRQADDAQRQRLRAATGAQRWSGVARAVIGGVLVFTGGAAFLVDLVNLNGTAAGLAAALVVACGLALVSGPWWLRMARELTTERAARIREHERAEVAAHVHDSVLHTLTLIQRNVGDPREVTRLARAQERELRGWLYRPRADGQRTVRSALERAAAEVEDAHGVAIEVVVVGDCPTDESMAAVVQAAREALVNAAKYADDSPISVYAEVEPGHVTVFVRDRGPGFVLEAVPADRLGLRESVVGRMQRHGGTAVVRSGGGAGTEIQLEMPRSQS
jgi:signal transduction histidine kinase